MAWLWNSWEEYVDRVHPVEIIHSGAWETAQHNSLFENNYHLCEAAEKLCEALQALSDIGFKGSRSHPAPKTRSTLGDAYRLVIEATHAGELLLLYDKRLAQSEAGYPFLHAHTLMEHWARYANTDRIFIEIDEYVLAARSLVNDYYKLVESAREFLVGEMEIPDDLKGDFQQARDLFSVGLGETGLLIAGRGLEGVLRRMMDVRKITFCSNPLKGKPTPASEADFRDLIEIVGQLRWKRDGTRLITPDVKHLLHYLRAIRNSGAHPNGGQQPTQSVREVAMVIAQTANQLWKAVTTTRARLDAICVTKTW